MKIAEKGFNSISHCILVHKFCSYASSDENSECKSSSGQRMGESRKVAGVTIEHCEQQKGGSYFVFTEQGSSASK